MLSVIFNCVLLALGSDNTKCFGLRQIQISICWNNFINKRIQISNKQMKNVQKKEEKGQILRKGRAHRDKHFFFFYKKPVFESKMQDTRCQNQMKIRIFVHNFNKIFNRFTLLCMKYNDRRKSGGTIRNQIVFNQMIHYMII